MLGSFKDLVIDAVDAPRLGAFWASALGLEVKTLDDGYLVLSGPTPRHAVWINQVPEPVTVKQRVHFDVHTGSVGDLLALGATPLDLESFRWKVLRDPEGGELCAFERAEVPEQRLYALVVDVADPPRIATWWAELLGGVVKHDQESSWLEGVPGMPFDGILFQGVPEPKTVKNRIHWDVTVPDLAPLLDHGARVVRRRDDEIGWTVMADPEGNEFCAFEEG